jgi:phospholipid N-methyltransferase
MADYTATYSPEDNKLRLYSESRLDSETYEKAKHYGFKWAPKQGFFVAPKWTPNRETFLINLCGEIGDEDTSLVERAEERATRFEEYGEKREADAHAAKEGVKEITKHIPFGQPILVGHHSEKRARKDAERIENGMRKAVKMWETSEYWKDRAASALHHAKYKERPDVRARRIKKIEADIRRCKAAYTPKNPDQVINQIPWNCPVCNKYYCKTHPEAEIKVPHVYCGASRGGSWIPVKNLPGIEKYYSRWITHYEMRLLYEKTMLGEQGALDLIKPKVRPKQLPLLNYKAPDGIKIENRFHKGEFEIYEQIEMTKAQFKNVYEDYRGTRIVENSHRVRISMVRIKDQYGLKTYAVFLTDSKTHKKPELVEVKPVIKKVKTRQYTPPERTEFDDLKDSLKEGVKVVSTPQLFPTPKEIADQMITLLDVSAGETVLEPSAGTGVLIDAVLKTVDTEVLAYEINIGLCRILRDKFPSYKCQVRQKDFLTVTDFQGQYSKIIMNPPFVNGEDIKHIKHAITFLKPGGRLVALCANGPRQKAQLEPLADLWEPLPEGSFKESGTNVNVVMMVIEKN